jgi:CheY-like chemotaxis protein
MYCLYDQDKLEKIVSNLLANAMKFTPAGGKILVGLDTIGEADDKLVEITVQDTGRGIPKEDLERIFDRFEQVDTTHRREFEGTGIGLALVRELTELHGGTVTVDSRPGFGSTFKILLPLEDVASHGSIPGVQAGSVTDAVAGLLQLRSRTDGLPGGLTEEEVVDGPTKESILIVEDNAEVREYLRGHLDTDFRVIEAENGEEGLRTAKSSRPSLILTDIMMPVMDGYEMVRRIREDDALSYIPIVMLTAKADEGGAVTGIQSGADDYIAKPFDITELKARLANLISKRSEMRERFSEEVVVKGSDLVVTSGDAAFLQTITEIIDTHLGDTNFGGDWLADEVGLSRRQLERRLESILGESPAALIRRLRLERASQLLRARAGTVSEVAYSVGFTSPAYFARAFRKAYGESPTEHAQNAT